MFADKTQRDIDKFIARLADAQTKAGLAQLNDEAAEDLVLGIIESITDNIILEGIGFDRPRGAEVNWSHQAGGGIRSTYVSFVD